MIDAFNITINGDKSNEINFVKLNNNTYLIDQEFDQLDIQSGENFNYLEDLNSLVNGSIRLVFEDKTTLEKIFIILKDIQTILFNDNDEQQVTIDEILYTSIEELAPPKSSHVPLTTVEATELSFRSLSKQTLNDDFSLSDLSSNDELRDSNTFLDPVTQPVLRASSIKELPASFSGDVDGKVKEDNTLSVSGRVDIEDNNPKEATFDPSLTESLDQYGSFFINEEGEWRYLLNNESAVVQSLSEGEELIEKIVIVSHDGTQQEILITITGTNDDPVLDDISEEEVSEDDAKITGEITSRDVDNDATSKYTTTKKVSGFTLAEDGSYSFDPSHADYQELKKGEEEKITIPVTVTDDQGATDTKNLVITITGTNDAPVVQDVSLSDFATEGNGLEQFDGQVDASDVDGDSVTFEMIGDVTLESLDIDSALITDFEVLFNEDGSYEVHGNFDALSEGESVTVSFDYQATDSHSAKSEVKTIELVISGSRDLPIAQDDGENGLDAIFEGNMYASMGDDFNDVLAEDAQAFSFSVVINPNDYSNNDKTNHEIQNVFLAKSSDLINDNLEIGINTFGQLMIYIDTKGEREAVTTLGSVGIIEEGVDNYIAMSYDQGVFIANINGEFFYDNATLAFNTDNGLSDSEGALFTVGGSTHEDIYLDGAVSSVVVHDRVLSRDEMSSFIEDQTVSQNGLAANYQVQLLDGVVKYIDQTGNHNEGLIYSHTPGNDNEDDERFDDIEFEQKYISIDEDSTVNFDVLGNDTTLDVNTSLFISKIQGQDVSLGQRVNITAVIEEVETVVGTAEVIDGKIAFTPGDYFDTLIYLEAENLSFDYHVSNGIEEDSATLTMTIKGLDNDEAPTATDDLNQAVDVGDVLVNTETNNVQSLSHISSLKDGGYIVSWESNNQDGSGYGIYSQRYDKFGNPVGDETFVNFITSRDQRYSSTIGLEDGGYVVSYVHDGTTTTNDKVYFTIFNSDGSVRADTVLFSSPSNFYQNSTSNMVALEDGGFVIVTRDQEGSDVVIQRYSEHGSKVGELITVNEKTNSHQLWSNVSLLEDGNIAVSWSDRSSGTYNISTAILEVTEDGLSRVNDSDILVSDLAQNEFRSDLVGLDNGGYVTVWDNHAEVYMRIFDANGQAITEVEQVNDYATDVQYYPSVSALEDGYVVVWASKGQDGSSFGVYMQLYTNNGEKIGGELQVSDVTKASQNNPEVTTLEDGSFVITYSNSGGRDGANWGVYTKRFNADGTEFTEYGYSVVNTQSALLNVLSNDSEEDEGDSIFITHIDGQEITQSQSIEITQMIDSQEVVIGTARLVNVAGVNNIEFTPSEFFLSMQAGSQQTVSFEYTISDTNNNTDSALVEVNIIGSLDAPSANEDSITGLVETEEIVLNVLDNDSDPQGVSTVNITAIDNQDVSSGQSVLITEQSEGELIILGEASVVQQQGADAILFKPGGHFDQIDDSEEQSLSLSYTITDDEGLNATAKVDFIITGEDNETPIALGDKELDLVSFFKGVEASSLENISFANDGINEQLTNLTVEDFISITQANEDEQSGEFIRTLTIQGDSSDSLELNAQQWQKVEDEAGDYYTNVNSLSDESTLKLLIENIQTTIID